MPGSDQPLLTVPRRILEYAAALPRLIGRVLIHGYRYVLSPLIGPRCRHLPSCSEYGETAIMRHGLWAGSWMTLARLLRCQPWGTHGLDFVPDAPPAGARWYLPWRYGRWRGTNPTPPGQTMEPGCCAH